MLVLTRRETEKILFPTLGISIEVMRVQGNKTRLGVDARAVLAAPPSRRRKARPELEALVAKRRLGPLRSGRQVPSGRECP